MDRRVSWSPEALGDVEAIAEYIERDSPAYARAVVQKVLASTRKLVSFPRSGRVVPELEDDAVCEFSVHSHRVIFQHARSACAGRGGGPRKSLARVHRRPHHRWLLTFSYRTIGEALNRQRQAFDASETVNRGFRPMSVQHSGARRPLILADAVHRSGHAGPVWRDDWRRSPLRSRASLALAQARL